MTKPDWEGFGKWATEHWQEWNAGIDSEELNDALIEHRLLVPIKVTQPCQEDCVCEETDNIPGTCYRRNYQ